MMKLAIGTLLLGLLVGTNIYAQEQQREKEKAAPQEQKKQEPDAKEHSQAQQQQKTQTQQQEKPQDQQKNQAKQSEKERSDAAKHQQQAARQQQQQQQQVARQDRANQSQHAQRDGGNRNSRRISEQEFHSHFGREHTFRVTRSEGRRFSYGGYYFVYNDPWPSDWAYTDDVYVDETDDEYYLIDPVHPGIRLLIVVVD